MERTLPTYGRPARRSSWDKWIYRPWAGLVRGTAAYRLRPPRDSGSMYAFPTSTHVPLTAVAIPQAPPAAVDRSGPGCVRLQTQAGSCRWTNINIHGRRRQKRANAGKINLVAGCGHIARRRPGAAARPAVTSDWHLGPVVRESSFRNKKKAIADGPHQDRPYRLGQGARGTRLPTSPWRCDMMSCSGLFP